jgi:hypothetical protein
MTHDEQKLAKLKRIADIFLLILHGTVLRHRNIAIRCSVRRLIPNKLVFIHCIRISEEFCLGVSLNPCVCDE